MRTSKGLIARKIGMTRMVDSNGQLVPVTLVKVETQKVTKVLNTEKNGYEAVQIGYFVKRESRLNKPDIQRLRKAGVEENFSKFRELRLNETAGDLGVGAEITAALLAGVTAVDVTGVTKGRGFTGSVKRWNTARGRMTHGSRFHRRPGSLGTRTTPGRVFKNKPVHGHYGDEQVTIQNLAVMDVDVEQNVIALKGSVPGHRDGFLVVRPSVKL